MKIPAYKKIQNSIEAVTVCVYQADRLKYCISNRHHFDRWMIVTVPDDTETIHLCQMFKIEYCFTKRVFSKGATFAKGRAINDGLSQLDKRGWLLQLDCDVVLPKMARELILSIPLNEKNISTLFSVRGRRALGVHPTYRSTRDLQIYYNFHRMWVKEGYPRRSNGIIPLKEFQILKRKHGLKDYPGSIEEQWTAFKEERWHELLFPFEGGQAFHLGYFQLFHSKKHRHYPEKSTNANHDDVSFREIFPRRFRKFLDCECIHLGVICDGRFFFRHFDNYVSQLKHVGKYAYLNKFQKFKHTKSSRLRILKNARTAIPSLSHTKKSRPLKWPLQTGETARYWATIGSEAGYWRPYCPIVFNKIVEAYEFDPEKSKKDWFAVFLKAYRPFSTRGIKVLCFNFKPSGMNCDIEVGFGSSERMEWVLIDLGKLQNDRWHRIEIELNKLNQVDTIERLISFRNFDLYRSGKFHVSEICYR